jgi:hypothetical protein
MAEPFRSDAPGFRCVSSGLRRRKPLTQEPVIITPAPDKRTEAQSFPVKVSVNRLQIVKDPISVRFGRSGVFNPDGQREHPKSHQYDQHYHCPKLTNRLDLPVLVRFRHVITSKFDISNLRES